MIDKVFSVTGNKISSLKSTIRKKIEICLNNLNKK
jgi:hypothetical protein